MTTRRKSSRGDVVPGVLRKVLKDKRLKLRCAITNEIKYRTKLDVPLNYKIILLKEDIENCPIMFLLIYISLAGSYQSRCNTAVSAYNYGPSYIKYFHKKATNQSPGMYTKQYINKSIERRNKSSQRRLIFKTQIKRKLFNKGLMKTMVQFKLKIKLSTCHPLNMKKKVDFLSKLKITSDEMHALERRTVDQSSSDEWRRQRSLSNDYCHQSCRMRQANQLLMSPIITTSNYPHTQYIYMR
ncbi:hypothetical protein QTP88_016912 [Uroleucon formosanum]